MTANIPRRFAAEVPQRDTKRCTRCLETRPRSHFPEKSGGGVASRCRECKAELSRDYYERAGRARRHLRLVIDRNGRTVSRSALATAKHELLGADSRQIRVLPIDEAPTCVCGHGEYFHQRGPCACGCPEWFERGL